MSPISDFFFKTKGTQRPKTSKQAVLRDWFEKKNAKGERVVYIAEFMMDSSFGMPGAITVLNRHQREFFLESITVEGFSCGKVHFSCYSWVQPTRIHPAKRVFFSNKVSHPSLLYNFSRMIIKIISTNNDDNQSIIIVEKSCPFAKPCAARTCITVMIIANLGHFSTLNYCYFKATRTCEPC